MTGTLTQPGGAQGWEDAARNEALRHTFWLVFALGATSVLFGVAVLAWPDATTRVLAVLLGVWLMILGAARTVAAFTPHRGLGRQVLSGIVGVILLIAGIACLRDLAKGMTVLAFVVALTWISSGIAELVIAAHSTGATRWWMAAIGLICIVVGLVFVFVPELSLTVLSVMIGLTGLVIGVSELIFAFQIRRLASEPATAVRPSAGLVPLDKPATPPGPDIPPGPAAGPPAWPTY